MADLLCEAYDVCYGTGLADPAPRIVSLPYRTRVAAQDAATQLNAQARAGGFDPASVQASLSFFVRARPGQQLLAVPTGTPGDPPTAEEIQTALAGADVMVPVFVRHLNPPGFVAVAVVSRDAMLSARGGR